MNNPEDTLRNDIELGNALKRLVVDPDYIKVINESYINNTLINESEGILDSDPLVRQETIEKIQSVHNFKRHIMKLKNAGECATEDFSEQEEN